MINKYNNNNNTNSKNNNNNAYDNGNHSSGDTEASAHVSAPTTQTHNPNVPRATRVRRTSLLDENRKNERAPTSPSFSTVYESNDYWNSRDCIPHDSTIIKDNDNAPVNVHRMGYDENEGEDDEMIRIIRKSILDINCEDAKERKLHMGDQNPFIRLLARNINTSLDLRKNSLDIYERAPRLEGQRDDGVIATMLKERKIDWKCGSKSSTRSQGENELNENFKYISASSKQNYKITEIQNYIKNNESEENLETKFEDTHNNRYNDSKILNSFASINNPQFISNNGICKGRVHIDEIRVVYNNTDNKNNSNVDMKSEVMTRKLLRAKKLKKPIKTTKKSTFTKVHQYNDILCVIYIFKYT